MTNKLTRRSMFGLMAALPIVGAKVSARLSDGLPAPSAVPTCAEWLDEMRAAYGRAPMMNALPGIRYSDPFRLHEWEDGTW